MCVCVCVYICLYMYMCIKHDNNLYPLSSQPTFSPQPSMKLQIPAQLIVLSLWLLENKYSSTARQSPRFSDTERGRQGLRGGNTLRTSSMSPSDVKRGGNKRVSPARGRGHSRSSSGSPQRQVIGEVMLEAQQAGLARSLPLSSLRDEEEIRTAYEQVLEG